MPKSSEWERCRAVLFYVNPRGGIPPSSDFLTCRAIDATSSIFLAIRCLEYSKSFELELIWSNFAIKTVIAEIWQSGSVWTCWFNAIGWISEFLKCLKGCASWNIKHCVKLGTIFWTFSRLHKTWLMPMDGGTGVWGCRGGEAPPDFGASINPIITIQGRICPPYYYSPPRCSDLLPSLRVCIYQSRTTANFIYRLFWSPIIFLTDKKTFFP